MQNDDFSSLEIALELIGGCKAEPSNEFAAIARLLIADRDAAWKRFRSDRSPPSKREMVRVTLAAIEGLLWQLKQHLLRDPEKVAALSIHERAALLDESYVVDERGNVRTQPRFLPTISSIKLVTRILQKFQHEYTLDFSDETWRHVQVAGIASPIRNTRGIWTLQTWMSWHVRPPSCGLVLSPCSYLKFMRRVGVISKRSFNEGYPCRPSSVLMRRN
jgi:hypothetical protein